MENEACFHVLRYHSCASLELTRRAASELRCAVTSPTSRGLHFYARRWLHHLTSRVALTLNLSLSHSSFLCSHPQAQLTHQTACLPQQSQPSKMAVDYGVYLVTDSTPAILGSRDLAAVVEASLRGGTGIVQYRDKTASHDDAVRAARELLAVTRRFGVPLLVNDRVEVAVEIGCEGVHIGQDDMGRSTCKPHRLRGRG